MLNHLRHIAICLGIALSCGVAAADFTVIESTTERCRVSFSVPAPSAMEDDSTNPAGKLLEWPDAGMLITRDFLQPVRSVFVVVPPGTAPQLQIGSIRTSSRSYGMAGRPEQIPIEQDALATDWVRLAEIQEWRGFRIAQIEIVLQQGGASSSTLLESLDFAVNFSGTPAALAIKERESLTLELHALNGDIAARWWQEARPRHSSLDELSVAWPEFDLYKLTVSEKGFYAVSGAWLQANGANLVNQPISSIRMFGNGGKLIHKLPSHDYDTELKENAIHVVDVNGNGIFEAQDSVYFYAVGLKGYTYCDSTHLAGWAHQSPYAYENAYWIGSDPNAAASGLRMGNLNTAGPNPQLTTTARLYQDNDQYIYDHVGYQLESGLIWYFTAIDPLQERTFSFFCEEASGGPGRLRVRNRTQGDNSYAVTLYVNNEEVASRANTSTVTADIPEGVLSGSGSTPVRMIVQSDHLAPTQQKTHNLNWIELEYERRLAAPSGSMEILAPADANGVFSYTIEGLSGDSYLLDVTDPLKPNLRRGSSFSDSSSADNRGEYFVLRADRVRTPFFRGVSRVDPALDYNHLRDSEIEAGVIIITYDDWYDALEPLVEFHRNYEEEPLKAIRVKIGDIFNEFGWGNYDPVAIRNFLRYAYNNWRGPSGNAEQPRYAFFVGVGDYDYRNLIDGADRNWIPPWNDFDVCSDDFYVEFDESSANLLQMMTGRWPCESIDEVEALVEKTILYAGSPLYGPWKNTATFVADDEYKGNSCGEKFHSRDSEALINQVLPEYFTFRKLYQILYPFRTSTTTSQKPDGTQDLLETINLGTLLINYNGHGNERIWTDEQLFVMDRDFPLIQNYRRWPVFVAATCTWGGYDRPNERCFPELLLADPEDGAIACIAATRFTFVSQNQQLTEDFYQELFRPGLERRASLGEALRVVKPLRTRNNLYHCLGNPVLRLATPEYFAYVEARDDSLQALALFHLSGYVSRDAPPMEVVEKLDGSRRRTLDEPEVWSDFQGVVEARVFDTEDSAAYYWCNNPTDVFYYGLPGNAIFRGLATIENGHFDVTFRVPRDIQYGGTNAKVSLYFYGKSDSESDSADGIGIERPLLIASAASTEIDSLPPQIVLWMEAPSFRAGDQVSREPLLHVDIEDESGLNLSGAVGHRITVRIDDAATEDLTPFFNYRLDSHTSGSLEKTIGPLSPGEHRLLIEAWDSFNNLNQISSTFVVGSEGEGGYEIRDVYNWPNPMSDETYFTYSLTQAGTRDVKLKIFTLTGKLVYEMDNLGTRQLYNSNSDRPWFGRDREGHTLANGVYLYKIIAEHEQGHSAEAVGKLIILR